MNGSADVAVADLFKGFGSRAVLTGLHLTVPPGALAAVLGPSASGKTTLLRILAGFDRPDRGTVRIGGTLVDGDGRHVPPERRRIGYVSQEGSLFPHLTVAGNVAFGVPRRERRTGRVRELVAAVGLTESADRYPHQLSGGQQQRAALARALAVRPELVLLDEPFAALDAGLRGRLRAEVFEVLRAAGTTTILVTHDQDEALSSADLVAVIRDGRIVQSATPQELYDEPADVELARFVGAANVLDGRADGGLVDTRLGRLALRNPVTGRVLVLVRPEQLQVHRAGPGGAGAGCGLLARVVAGGFHGHDAVLTVQPEGGLPELAVRVPGDLRLPPGSAVRLTVRGPVRGWPADGGG
jgi:iron(III) transport system ATP-binding protein